MSPWVRRLIIANIVMFGLQNFVPGLTAALILRPADLLVRPWTIVTYMFLHGGLMHIAFNMLTLYFFGPPVEERLGSQRFIVFYLLCGIGGGLASFIQPNVPILGASAAIMGVSVAFAMFWPRQQVLLFGIVPLQAWMLVVGYILFDLIGFDPGIAHLAHLGGAATGFLYLKIVDYTSPARAFRRKVTRPPRSPVVGGIGNGDPLKRWRDIRLDDLHPINRDEVVRLLKKAQQHGTRSLTNEERATLDRFAGTA